MIGASAVAPLRSPTRRKDAGEAVINGIVTPPIALKAPKALLEMCAIGVVLAPRKTETPSPAPNPAPVKVTGVPGNVYHVDGFTYG